MTWMPSCVRLRSLFVLTSLAVLVSVVPAVAEAVDLEKSEGGELRLDVGVRLLEPGVEGMSAAARERNAVFHHVRESEARYIAVHLMKTLDAADAWGTVRVLPRNVDALDLILSGEIRRSNGSQLRVDIEVTDAAGRRWYKKRYKGRSDPTAYELETGDPYEFFYNEIASDLRQAWLERDPREIDSLKELSRLRFAADLAPAAFAAYLRVDKRGHFYAERLPARDDALMARITEIRQRDLDFLGVLTGRYEQFHDDMQESYDFFRAESYEEQRALEKLDWEASQHLLQEGGFGIGAWNSGRYGARTTYRPSISRHQQAKMEYHHKALHDLAAAFDAELEPLVVEIEGQTRRLQGSAETQYVEWRRLLREIYAHETGLPLETD